MIFVLFYYYFAILHLTRSADHYAPVVNILYKGYGTMLGISLE